MAQSVNLMDKAAAATLLLGKTISEKLREELARNVRELKERTKQTPKMAAIRIHEDQASELYLKSQRRVAESVGVLHETISEPGASEARLVQLIEAVNRNPEIHGVMVQMPLPADFRIDRILDRIDPKKDMEGVTSFNLGQLVLKKDRLVPCTALACLRLIEETGESLFGKEATVVGSSKVVGRPVSLLLLDRMVTTTTCHLGTAEAGYLESHVRRADILVAAVGKPNVIPGNWIKKGATVIDVGINRVNGKTIGDVGFEEAKKRARYITPVPGGVGPLTVTILMRNLLTAFQWQMLK